MSHTQVETAQSITAWAENTFGSDGTDFRLAARANKELAELIGEMGAADTREPCTQCIAPGRCHMSVGACHATKRLMAAIRTETADVAIVLVRLLHRHNAHGYPPPTLMPTPPPDVVALACYASGEMGELLSIIYLEDGARHRALPVIPPWQMETILAGTPDDAKPVCASAAVILAIMSHICQLCGGALVAEVDAKMAVNRARVWTAPEAGAGGYYRHEPAAAGRGDGAGDGAAAGRGNGGGNVGGNGGGEAAVKRVAAVLAALTVIGDTCLWCVGSLETMAEVIPALAAIDPADIQRARIEAEAIAAGVTMAAQPSQQTV